MGRKMKTWFQMNIHEWRAETRGSWEFNRSRLRLAWGPFVRPLEKGSQPVPIHILPATWLWVSYLTSLNLRILFLGWGLMISSYGRRGHQRDSCTKASSTMHACSKCGINAVQLPISMPFQPRCLQMITSFIVLHPLVGFQNEELQVLNLKGC